MTTLKYISFSLLAAISTILIHEITHWTMGELLGYKMIMTLNSGWPAKGFYDEQWHYTLISAVGPGITLIQAILFFFILKNRSNKYLYPFLIAPFFLELMSGLMNFRKPNDLGRISTTYSLGLFTLSILFVGIYFLFIFLISKRNKYGLKFNLITVGWVSLFSIIWIGINQWHKIYLIT